ncbi:hypothetical protein JL720_7851 [Aureococcus anophagefferens]|nr:hypothetical protein JL720_7851 [Aureococcus anophagefferens]
MAVCADEMVACLEETAGLGPNVDQSAVGLSLEADSAALRPVLKLEGLLARIEERRVRSLRLAEIDGDGVITYGEPGGATTCRGPGLAPLLDAPEAARRAISVKTAHAAIGHATLHSARHTEKHGDESKASAARTARDAKAPRTHTMMLQSEAGKAAQTTELLFRARCREIFNNIDADHSGEIDLEELGVAMKLLGARWRPRPSRR